MREGKFILLILSIIALCSCNGDRFSSAFVQSDEIRLQVGGSMQLRYDPLKCQLSFSRELCEFRVCTDNMSDFFCLSLDGIPAEPGQVLVGSLVWTTHTDVLTKNNLALEVLHLEGGKVWLWSKDARIGACVEMLD